MIGILGLAGCVAASLVVGGCGVVEQRAGQRLDSRVVAEVIERRTRIGLERSTPPATVPGLPSLAATLSGGTPTERITVLDFYTAQATEDVLGGAPVDGREVLRRQNLVIIYERSRGSPNHRVDLQAALDAATYRG